MVIRTTSLFEKHLKKRILNQKTLKNKFISRVSIFAEDPENPILQDHKLIGAKKELRSFSITGDLRVIYRKEAGVIYFLDIGSHNQVY